MSTLREHYNSIKYFTYMDKTYSINREYLKNEFAWLYDHIDKLDHFSKYNITINDEYNQLIVQEKYINLLIYIKQLPRINMIIMKYNNNDYEHDTESNQHITNQFLEKMETVFNKYIFISNKEEELLNSSEWTEYYRVILFGLHLITTHLDEIEFDLFISK